ncbi:MAG: hypothetical protein U0790_03445 [Isosphaeraceae bacterium]
MSRNTTRSGHWRRPAPLPRRSRQTGQPIGEVELILGLRRRLHSPQARTRMYDPNDTIEHELDPAARECLSATRSGVLNVLVAVGLTVALTGALLRSKAPPLPGDAPGRPGGALLASLLLVFAASTVLRRWLGGRARLREPSSRGSRFYWAHVLPALVGAIAAPLGLAHGLLISPGLESILPFWVTALVLGLLAYPRGRELEGFDLPMARPGDPAR